MEKYAQLFMKWSDEGHELWIFFNNDWFGYGIENALSLQIYLEQLTPQAPVDSGNESYRGPR